MQVITGLYSHSLWQFQMDDENLSSIRLDAERSFLFLDWPLQAQCAPSAAELNLLLLLPVVPSIDSLSLPVQEIIVTAPLKKVY